jgi:hypothetical protein
VRTLAASLGSDRARLVCWGALLLAAALAALLSPWLTNKPALVIAAAVLAGVIVGLDAIIWSRDPKAGVLAAFPCVAIAAVILGIGWAAALVSG